MLKELPFNSVATDFHIMCNKRKDFDIEVKHDIIEKRGVNKRRKTSCSIVPFLTKRASVMSDSPVRPSRVFEPTPFKAAALNSFYNIAEMAKERSKQYYSHLGIEIKTPH